VTTCRACRAPPTCRIRFRSSRAEALLIAYEYAGPRANVYLKDPGPAPWTPGWASRSALGRGHAGRRRLGLQRSDWFDRSGNFPQRRVARGGALHAHEPGRDQLRGDHRGSRSRSRARGR
jgi:hypothetical protein